VPGRAPESGRSYPLGRPLLLLGWTLVLWGTVVAVSLVWRTLQDGPATALGRLVSGTSAMPSTLGWINLACALIALGVWATLAVLLLRGEAPPE
jgi:hypothetical protein